jgi:MoxR-like ATPase
MSTVNTPPAPVNALDALLASPSIAALCAVAPTLAAAAVAARAERGRLITAAATAAASPFGASVPSADGAAPIIRAPWTGAVPTAPTHFTAPPAFLTRLKVHAEVGRPVLLTGPSGTGKTEAVMLTANALGRPFVKIDCGPVRESSDWFGSQTIVSGRVGWQDSILVAALETEGCFILFDEVNRASTAALNGLFGLLDGTRCAHFPQRAEAVRLAPNVAIFATANIGLSYSGTGAIDRAFANRFTAIPTDYLAPEDEAALLRKRYTALPITTANAIARIAAHTRTAAYVASGGDEISTRQALVCADMAVAFAVKGHSEALAIQGLIDSQSAETMGAASSPRAALSAFVARTFPSFI